MKIYGSVASVIAAVHDEATAQIEALDQEVAVQLERLRLDEASEPAGGSDREARLAAARREARERLAREDWRDARAALEEREGWIGRVVEQARQHLTEPLSARAQRSYLAQLVREALQRLPGDSFTVTVSAADAALLDDGWCRDLAAGAGKQALRVVVDPAVAGGCIVGTADGKASFDNTFPARARRFEAVWRAALGALYGA